MKILSARFSLAAVLAIAMAATLAACGEDSGDDKSSEPEKLQVTETQEGKGKWKLSVPSSVKAGLVEIEFSSPPGKGGHEAQFVRVEGDHSEAEVLKIINAEGGPIPQWLRGAGGVGETKAGETGTATQVLEPGKYYAFDNSEPEGENVKSYAQQGAVASFEVTGEPQSAELPETDAKVTAKDYTFTAEGLKAGKNTIEFDNVGKELHHVIAFPFKKGATFDQVKKAFESEGPPKGPPPFDETGIAGTSVLDGGTKQTTDLDLKSGKYALVCFIQDRKGGPPHVAKGMIIEADVE